MEPFKNGGRGNARPLWCCAIPLLLIACAPVETTGSTAVPRRQEALAGPQVVPPGAHGLTNDSSAGVRVAASPDIPPVAQVRVFDDDYEPNVVSAKVGEVIEWYHTGFRLHTITAINFSWDSRGFAPGDVFRINFNRAGTYQYFCTEHPWMRGIVVVTE